MNCGGVFMFSDEENLDMFKLVLWLPGNLIEIHFTYEVWGEGEAMRLFILDFPCHFNPADHKKWVRQLTSSLQLHVLFF